MQLAHLAYFCQHIGIGGEFLAHGFDFGAEGGGLFPLALVVGNGDVFQTLLFVIFKDGVPLGEQRAEHFVEHADGDVAEGHLLGFGGYGDGGAVALQYLPGGVEEGVEGVERFPEDALIGLELHYGDPCDELHVDLPGGFTLKVVYFPFAFQAKKRDADFEAFKDCVGHGRKLK